MAAGTDITHPVSALEGAYKPIPLEPLPVCTVKENGVAVDNNDDSSLTEKIRKDQGASRPPRPNPGTAPPTASFVRRSVSTARLTSVSASDLDTDASETSERTSVVCMDRSLVEFTPVIRSGGWMEQGTRHAMEDTHLRIDNLVNYWQAETSGSSEVSLSTREGPGAFYGVFDGHGGTEAADYVRDNLLTNFLKDKAFPVSLGEAVRSAFYTTDRAFYKEFSRHPKWTSGTTALAAVVFGRNLLVANAGDCRAVLSKRGKAVQMSRDHKPSCAVERSRIESVGGFVDDGYLNGQLTVARALGDWHLTGLKEFRAELPGCSFADGPLSWEPELQQAVLTDEDEFMILGCDGLWDVFTSQNAIDFARKSLQAHNDPELCSKELVSEALVRNTSDNLTVVTVCFQRETPPKLSKTWVPRFKRSISAEGLRNLQDLLDHNAS